MFGGKCLILIIFLFFLKVISCEEESTVNFTVSRQLISAEMQAAREKDLPLVKSLKPLKEGDNVFFWRLQKVGSSTLLSILMSYGYRYNFLPRRKSGGNANCRKLAKCALASNVTLEPSDEAYLSKYIKQKTPGSVQNVQLTKTVLMNENRAGEIPYKISLSHEMCNLNEKIIQDNLKCSFSDPKWPDNSNFNEVKELFMLRDPVARSISVYYFWGELFKLSHANKLVKGSGSTIPMTENMIPRKTLNTTIYHEKLTHSANTAQQLATQYGIESKNQAKMRLRNKQQVRSEDQQVSLSDTSSSSSNKKSKTSTKSTDSGRKLRENTASEVEGSSENSVEKPQSAIESAMNMFKQLTGTATTTATAGSVTTTATTQPNRATMLKYRSSSHAENNGNVLSTGMIKLGKTGMENKVIDGTMFKYHGEESTVPPMELAMAYANALPYHPGMPGPTYSWSAFSNRLSDAVDIVRSDRMVTVVVERLDESLVVAAHYLGWSLADMVVTKHRKALSSHPKVSEWPEAVISAIRGKMNANGEYKMYNESIAKLDKSIVKLKERGIDVGEEVKLLKALQKRVTKICLDDTYLLNYREDMNNRGMVPHPSQNKLRDVEEKYLENGHIYSLNREIICSFDVCGSCEAHALLFNMKDNRTPEAVETATPLAQTDRILIEKNMDFKKCPSVFTYKGAE